MSSDLTVLKNTVSSLLESGIYSDLTIHCRGTFFKVHCNIICTQCSIFANAVKEAKTNSEDQNPELDFSIEELPVLEALIYFLYNGDYEDKAKLELQSNLLKCPQLRFSHYSQRASWPSPLRMNPFSTAERPQLQSSPLTFNTKIFLASQKYHILSLELLAMKKYQQALESCFNIEDFCTSARDLWQHPQDNPLRYVVARFYLMWLEDQFEINGDWVHLPDDESFWVFVDDMRMELLDEEERKKGKENGLQKKDGRRKTGRKRCSFRTKNFSLSLPWWPLRGRNCGLMNKIRALDNLPGDGSES